ncbi:HNH endonuclease [Agromyces sp. SYSU T00194]|uniref:HNH endonuclease n=1 Tax=Agromyces chitinivorans TaxID=3158560 RepID=UPI0033931C04
MATSRTGTAPHIHFRRRVLQAGQDQGITHCPLCGCTLDYTKGRTPQSAEPDHIIPITRGGTNDPSNGRVLCRRCNQARGNRLQDPKPTAPEPPITTGFNW